MIPINIPNLPTKKVSFVIIDGRAPQKLKEFLLHKNIIAIETIAHPDVYSAIAYHPDIMFHHLGDNQIVYAPKTSVIIIEQLKNLGFKLIEGTSYLKKEYPHTIPYNIARVGKFAFHNTRYTDPLIRELFKERGVELIHVKQGYSKCLTCIVNDKSIITSDSEIYKKAKEVGIDVLLIQPDKSIELKPFDMGFIGGATGLIGKKTLMFSGNLTTHINYKDIVSFLSLKGVDMLMVNNENLMDLGSILPIMEI